MGLHTILYVTERDTLKEIVQFSRDAYMRCWSTRVGNEAESKIYGTLPGVYTHISGIDSIQVSIIFFLILIVTVSLSKSLRELGPFHKCCSFFGGYVKLPPASFCLISVSSWIRRHPVSRMGMSCIVQSVVSGVHTHTHISNTRTPALFVHANQRLLSGRCIIPANHITMLRFQDFATYSHYNFLRVLLKKKLASIHKIHCRFA